MSTRGLGPVDRIPDAEDVRSHDVYRIYDADDQLLYIGCALDGEHRIRAWHMNPFCAPLSVKLQGRIDHWTIERYPNKAEARQAEREAIFAEAPLFNKQHNPKRYSKRHGPIQPDRPHAPRVGVIGVAPGRFHTVPAAAFQLSLSERMVRGLLAGGQVDSFLLSRRRLISHRALVEFVDRLPRSPTP